MQEDVDNKRLICYNGALSRSSIRTFFTVGPQLSSFLLLALGQVMISGNVGEHVERAQFETMGFDRLGLRVMSVSTANVIQLNHIASQSWCAQAPFFFLQGSLDVREPSQILLA